MPRILIVGATGSIGRETARVCVARGAETFALVRSQTASLPASVIPRVGDLESPESLRAALRGIDAALYVSPHHTNEALLGENFLAAARDVPRLVYSSAFRFYSQRPWLDGFWRWTTGLIGPHYRPKLRVERGMRRAGAVILLPTNFFQNDDLFARELVERGEYPGAIGHKRVNAIDTRDVGEAAARALLDTSVAPGLYPLVGSESPTGPERAAAWSAALGRDVTYAGDDLDAWEALVRTRLPDAKRADFKKTLGVLQRFGIPTRATQLASTTALLGRAPRTFAAYAQERAAQSDFATR